MLDNAVTWFGRKVENLLHERVEVGKNRWEYKYTLQDLLADDDKPPTPPQNVEAQLRALAHLPGVLSKGY